MRQNKNNKIKPKIFPKQTSEGQQTVSQRLQKASYAENGERATRRSKADDDVCWRKVRSHKKQKKKKKYKKKPKRKDTKRIHCHKKAHEEVSVAQE